MSQGSLPHDRERKERALLFAVEVGPLPAQHPGPIPPVKTDPIPSVKTGPPISEKKRRPRPPTVMETAWAKAPMPKSFLEAIAQSRAIREGAYGNPANLAQHATPTTKPPTTGPEADRPATTLAPSQSQTLPARTSVTFAATGHVTKQVGPTIPSQSARSTLASNPITQQVGPTAPNPESGSENPMDEETASALELAQFLRNAARPDPRPYNEPGFYGPRAEPRDQRRGSGGQVSKWVSSNDQLATPPYALQPQTQLIGTGSGPSLRSGAHGKPPTYGPESTQLTQPPSATGSRRPSSYEGQRPQSSYSTPPAKRPGLAASSMHPRSSLDLRDDLGAESRQRAALLAKLQHATDLRATSAIEAERQKLQEREKENERKRHLQHQARIIEEKEKEDEKKRLLQHQARIIDEEERQWRRIQQRYARNDLRG